MKCQVSPAFEPVVKPSALVGPRFGELGALVVFLVTTVFPTNFPLEVAGVGVVVVVAR